MILKYLKNNLIKTLPLLLLSFAFALIFLYANSISNANVYLTKQIEENVTYELDISGRIAGKDFDEAIYKDGDNIKNELFSFMEILDNHDASYDLMCNVWLIDINTNKSILQNDSSKSTSSLYGTNIDYFDNNNIEIIEGDKLYEGCEKCIVVSENTYKLVDGEVEKIEVGDTIMIPLDFGSSPTNLNSSYNPAVKNEFTVVGIYKSRNINIYEYKKAQYKLNERYYISKEDFISLLNDFYDFKQDNSVYKSSITFPVSFIRVNNISFDIKDYSSLNELEYSINNSLNELNNELRQNSNDNKLNEYYEFTSSDDLVDKILLPFSSLTLNIDTYRLIFIVVFILLDVLIILFTVKERINESSIKMSMGMKYDDVLIEIIIENLIVVLIGSILAIFIYNLTVTRIVNNMLAECIDLQNSLYRITSKDIDGLNDAFSIFTDFSNVKVSFIYYFLIIAICELICILLTILVYKTNQPKNVKKALMSQ